MEQVLLTRIDPLPRPKSVAAWESRQPGGMKLAAWVNRLAPRGKGALPRWLGRHFGQDWRTSIRTESGCLLAVDPIHLDLFVTIEREGTWEPWIQRACQLVMRNGGVMFDVGANAGAISNETALACPNIQVIAFEPQTKLAELITVSAALNQLENIEVFSVAVGEQDATASLHQPAHALHASLMSSGDPGESVVDVPMISLDSFVDNSRAPAPDLIKVDVEGGELGVLRGATQLLKRAQPVILFEANDSAVRFGYDRNDLFSLIRACGDYRFRSVSPGDVLAVPAQRDSEFSQHYRRIEHASL